MKLFIVILLMLLFECTIGCKQMFVSSLEEAYSLGIDSASIVKVEKVDSGSSRYGNIFRIYYK